MGFNLCPFAPKPMKQNQVRIHISDAQDETAVLEALLAELSLLDVTPSVEIDTSLLVLPNALQDFEQYNQFLGLADALLQQFNWVGVYQIASFHPAYRFAGTEPDAAENFTNRSPYPILHILREASMASVLRAYPDPEQIPQRNIEKMRALSRQDKDKYFPYRNTASADNGTTK